MTKKTVHDTETIEVPVEREEVVIERRAVHDGEVDITDTTFDDETESITIPVHEEKVVVDKDTVVTEEFCARITSYHQYEQRNHTVK